MIACLIYYQTIKRGGGPSGYLYHLQKGMKQLPTPNFIIGLPPKKIGYTQPLIDKFNILPMRSRFSNVYQRVKGFIKKAFRYLVNRKSARLVDIMLFLYQHISHGREYYLDVLVIKWLLKKHKPKLLHIHDPFLLECLIGKLGKNPPKILLTWHTPSGYNEIYMRVKYKYGFATVPLYLNTIRKIINKSLKYVDYFIVPSLYCYEGHIRYQPELKNIISSKKTKLLLSGIDASSIKKDMERPAFLNSINIPDSKKIVSFTGRGHADKGYDLFMGLAHEMVDNENVLFLKSGIILDKNMPIPKNVITLGWIDNVYDLINASDVIMLPNRNCFFDLNLLESLSFGKIILTTNVGGHKEFKNITRGVFLAEPTVRDLKERLDQIMMLTRDQVEKLNMENSLAFSKYFSSEIFAKNYNNLITEIILENKLGS